MKAIKKTALAAAIIATPVAGFSMEAMEDEALSSVTGQDGITISLDLDVETDVTIVDKDGLAGGASWDTAAVGTDIAAGYSTDSGASIYAEAAGALVIENMKLFASGLTVDIDMADEADAATTARLFVGITLTNGLSIGDTNTTNLLTIGVKNVTPNATGLAATNAALYADLGLGATQDILSMDQISLSAGTEIGLELGNGSDMATLYGDIGTLTLTDFNILDPNGNAGSVGAFTCTSGSCGVETDVTVSGVILDGTLINFDDRGLVLTMGTGLSNIGITAAAVELGDVGTGANILGDVYITGLSMSGTTVAIQGH